MILLLLLISPVISSDCLVNNPIFSKYAIGSLCVMCDYNYVYPAGYNYIDIDNKYDGKFSMTFQQNGFTVSACTNTYQCTKRVLIDARYNVTLSMSSTQECVYGYSNLVFGTAKSTDGLPIALNQHNNIISPRNSTFILTVGGSVLLSSNMYATYIITTSDATYDVVRNNMYMVVPTTDGILTIHVFNASGVGSLYVEPINNELRPIYTYEDNPAILSLCIANLVVLAVVVMYLIIQKRGIRSIYNRVP